MTSQEDPPVEEQEEEENDTLIQLPLVIDAPGLPPGMLDHSIPLPTAPEPDRVIEPIPT